MPTPTQVRVFDRIRIRSTAPYFQGEVAVVAYVGTAGVSAAVAALDDYVPLKWDEFDLIQEEHSASSNDEGTAEPPAN